MKKLLFIILLFPLIGLSQTQTITSVNALKAKQWIDAPIFKINGTSIDTSTSTIRWFTKYKYALLNSKKANSDSVTNHGYATNYKLNQKVSSQWTTSSSNIYFNSGNVGLGVINPTSKLQVNGSVYFRIPYSTTSFLIYDTTNHTNILALDSQTKKIYIDDSNVGYKIGIGGITPTHTLDVNGGINSDSLLIGGVKKNAIWDAKQAALISGTNIKTINSTSLLGSGNINISGSSQWTTSGSDIYYNTGRVGIGISEPLKDLVISRDDGNATLRLNNSNDEWYWDMSMKSDNGELIFNSNSTNKYIGILNDSPTKTLDVNGSINGTSYYLNGTSLTPKLYYQKSIDTLDNLPYSNSFIKLVCQDTTNGKLYRTRSTRFQTALTNPVTGTGTSNYLTKFTGTSTVGNSLIQDDGTNVGIGTAPATYSLSVSGTINSTSTISAATVTASSSIGTTALTTRLNSQTSISIYPQDKDAPFIRFGAGNDNTTFTTEWARFVLGGSFGIGTTAPAASAKVEIVSTTQGLLPPRMTTTQREAISTPAEGLLVYDLTLHKLYCYNGSTWQACW